MVDLFDTMVDIFSTSQWKRDAPHQFTLKNCRGRGQTDKQTSQLLDQSAPRADSVKTMVYNVKRS